MGRPHTDPFWGPTVEEGELPMNGPICLSSRSGESWARISVKKHWTFIHCVIRLPTPLGITGDGDWWITACRYYRSLRAYVSSTDDAKAEVKFNAGRWWGIEAI